MNVTQRIPSWGEIALVASSRGMLSAAPHLWRGLVGAWPLHEPAGVAAYDVSGRGRHGTLTNFTSTGRTVGRYGRALPFAGGTEFVILPVTTLGPAWTAWALCSPTDLDGWILHAQVSSTSTETLRLRYVKTGDTIMYESDYGTSLSLSATPGEWHAVAAVQGSGSTRLHVDAATATDTSVTAPPQAVARLLIGRRDYDAGPVTFNGLIGPVALWNRPLTPAEIQQLYADPWAMYRLHDDYLTMTTEELAVIYRNLILGGGVF